MAYEVIATRARRATVVEFAGYQREKAAVAILEQRRVIEELKDPVDRAAALVEWKMKLERYWAESGS